MKKSTQYSLIRIILLSLGMLLWLVVITNNIRFSINRLESILGALTALGIALFFLWKANNKLKKERKKITLLNKNKFSSFFMH